MYVNFETKSYIYILTNKIAGTLYVGVTPDLVRRISQHIDGTYGGFTSKYGLRKLVYYEEYGSMVLAINREKALKKWRRDWKIALIEKMNPKWDDLYPKLAR